ncbi:HAD family hydrolase [Chungangia koreensis]|uniref:HAD family hydrolase n=1 Tax=Chungangia koreensis TaxID=752657 RepID=A0ABV8X7E0_9LACT
MKAYIFDMDGTLFRTNTILEKALEETFQHLREKDSWSGETPIEQYREIMGVPLPVVWKTLLPMHSETMHEEVDLYFLYRLIALIKSGQGALYTGVEELFEELRQSGSLFIASNGKKEYLKAIVDYYQLDRWVTETFSIEQIQSLNKSDLVRTIIEKYTVTSGAMVGDRLSDIKAGKENGLFSVGCHFDFAHEDELAQADLVIRDFKELTSTLKAN